MKTTDKQEKLFQACFDLEKEIYELWSNAASHCPVNNEDWTDTHQEYLETQWAKDELNEMYIQAQKDLFAELKDPRRKVKTASEYYKKQKELEKDVKYLREHHLNGF